MEGAAPPSPVLLKGKLKGRVFPCNINISKNTIFHGKLKGNQGIRKNMLQKLNIRVINIKLKPDMARHLRDFSTATSSKQ